jgi:hypothetical protein
MRTSKDELHIQKNLAVLKHHKLHISTLQVWFVLGWNENKSHFVIQLPSPPFGKQIQRKEEKVPQTVNNKPTHNGMITIECVPTTRVVIEFSLTIKHHPHVVITP